MKLTHRILVASLIACGYNPVASAAIIVDYSQDQASQNFFGNNATARSALEAAVADINAVLSFNLGAITNDTVTGTSGGGTSATFNFSYNYTNPATGGSETIEDTRLGAGEFRLFVGARNISGATLGQGGPGSGGIGIGWGVRGGPLSAAIAAAEASYQHRRGDGPTMLTHNGTLDGEDYSFGIGPTVGNMWFDQDTDDNGIADDQATLESNWHFDHTTDVAAGKSDFYSVALHETLHALGLGESETWDSLVNGTDWLGSEVMTLNGTGIGVIDGGGSHFTSDLMSVRLSDGLAQEVVMDPSVTTGTRKYLTELDVAILRDLGYSTVTAIPEPSGFFALAIIGSLAIFRRRRS